MMVHKIGRNTKPEYKKTISRVVKIQGTPGKYTGRGDVAIEAEYVKRLRNEAR